MGILEPIANAMLQVLQWFHNYTNNFAVDIVLLTVALRLLLAPLFIYQMKSMKKMQELQPQIKALQEKYKGEPEKLNKEIMELYRTNKANPLSGCLPLLVQMPFLFAIFNVLAKPGLFEGAVMFGFIPLDKPDPTYVLPILSGVVTFAQSFLSGTATDPNQKIMIYIMPIMITWFATQYASGVALYWFVSTLVGVIQQAIYPGFKRLTPQGEAAR